MKANKYVSDIMTRQLVTLCIHDDLVTAESLFRKNKIQHIPVVEDKNIVGMLSWNDLLRISFADAVSADGAMVDNEMYRMFDVEKIMTSRITSISPDTKIKKAAKIFTKEKFHALPVVENENLVGILTTTDIIKHAFNIE